MKNLNEVKYLVLEKLSRRKAWGRNPKHLTTIVKRMGWKRRERKLVKKAVMELIKERKLQWVDKSKKLIRLT